jgi:hypothetical protein
MYEKEEEKKGNCIDVTPAEKNLAIDAVNELI